MQSEHTIKMQTKPKHKKGALTRFQSFINFKEPEEIPPSFQEKEGFFTRARKKAPQAVIGVVMVAPNVIYALSAALYTTVKGLPAALSRPWSVKETVRAVILPFGAAFANFYTLSDYTGKLRKRTTIKALRNSTIPATISSGVITFGAFHALLGFAGLPVTLALTLGGATFVYAVRYGSLETLMHRIRGRKNPDVIISHQIARSLNRIKKQFHSEADQAVKNAFIYSAITTQGRKFGLDSTKIETFLAMLDDSDFDPVTCKSQGVPDWVFLKGEAAFKNNEFTPDIVIDALKRITHLISSNTDTAVVRDENWKDKSKEAMKTIAGGALAGTFAVSAGPIFADKFLYAVPVHLINYWVGILVGYFAALSSIGTYAMAGLDAPQSLIDIYDSHESLLSVQLAFTAVKLGLEYSSGYPMGNVAETLYAVNNTDRIQTGISLDPNSSACILAHLSIYGTLIGAAAINTVSLSKEKDGKGLPGISGLSKHLQWKHNGNKPVSFGAFHSQFSALTSNSFMAQTPDYGSRDSSPPLQEAKGLGIV